MKPLSVNQKYVIGLWSWMAFYAVTCFATPFMIRTFHLEGWPRMVLATLPALPIAGAIWVFLRYLDKVDEYVRAFLSKRFLSAIGLTLFISSAWGFAEVYAEAPHMPPFLVYPLVWAMFAVTSLLYRVDVPKPE